ncbi:uncharacterized protein UTRI_10424 [Ustilago trichophora]|uniref:Uncharacterized protein n=1 Tax=Ustilago trichophora TaxID=86804 RepID=A0A5C3ECE8_9BASI|nr:uncharacterized protein UTRI_10424 [Ustilago trichophora]
MFSFAFAMDPEPADLDPEATDLDDMMHKVAKEYYFNSRKRKTGLLSADSIWFPNQGLAYYKQTVGQNLVDLLHSHAKDSKGVIELDVPPRLLPVRSSPPSSPDSKLRESHTASSAASTDPAELRSRWFHRKFLRNQGASSSRPSAQSPAKYYVSIIRPDDPLGSLLHLRPTSDGMKLGKGQGVKQGVEQAVEQGLQTKDDFTKTPFGKQALALWRYENNQVNLVAIDTWSAPGAAVKHELTKLKKVIPVGEVREIVANAVPWFDLPDTGILHI